MTRPGPQPMPRSRTLPALIDEMAARRPRAEAIVCGDRRLDYAGLRRQARAVAKGLLALGLGKGDRIAILMGNVPEWVVAGLATTMIGGVLVALNTWATQRELQHMLRHSGARALILVPRYLKADYLAVLAALEPHAETLPALEHIVCLADAPPAPMVPFARLAERGRAVDDATLDAAAASVTADDDAYLLYTSGSTALPKGVPLRHGGLIENTFNIGERLHVGADDRFWLAVSLFWAFGCANALPNALGHGACVVLQEHFDAGAALRLIERERCSVVYATANMTQALWDHPERPARDLGSLRTGATLGTAEQIRRAHDLGVRDICQVYGLSESYGNCTVTDAAEPLELRLTTVGTALPGFAVRVVDPETGRPVPPGAVGEIRLNGHVTAGYYNDPDKTAEAFDADGFFRTGDLGTIDSAGRVRFRGRLKEMIKTGGINVTPVEVEQILMAHPAVESAFVIGLPDPVVDEVPAAVVVRRAGMTVEAAALDTHCRASLAAYKLPRRFRFATPAELPLTTTGKLQKNRLHELFAAETAERA